MADIDFQAVVTELNEAIYEAHGEEDHGFNYVCYGFVDVIRFDDVWLWNSENDDREWNDEENDHEPFVPFIKREFNRYANRVAKLKFEEAK